MMKKVIGTDTKAFFAVIIVLTIIAASLMIFKPITVGAFTAKGVEWENKTAVIATSEQPIITQHIVFGDSRPANCADGVYVESGGLAVPFSTKNEVYKSSNCAEADVVISNTVYKTTEVNPSVGKSPLAITGSQVADTTTYVIYYGLKTANAKTQATPLCQCSGERAGSPAPQAGCGWMGVCVQCATVQPEMCGEVSGCTWDQQQGCIGRTYCAPQPPTCTYDASCCGGLGGYTNDSGTTCFDESSCTTPCVACGSPEDLACGGFCPPGQSCSSSFPVASIKTQAGSCSCVSALPTYTNFSGNTTNFATVPNITNVSNCTLENPVYGKIVWSNTVNAEGANFDANVNIGSNFISINSSSMNASFDSPATVSLYGVTCPVTTIYEQAGYFSSAAGIISGGTVCPDCGILSCAGGTLAFTVTHFTGYAIGTTANLTIFDETDALGGSQTIYPGDSVKFFANYSNTSSLPITNATCMANYTDSFNNAMTYNETSKFYEYSRTFSSAGIYGWNVTCNKTGYDTLQANDTVNISVSFAPPPPITACTNIIYSGIWKLSNSIFSSPASACINITADDVTLNCTGYAIEGQNTAGTIGISAKNVKNLVVENCLVKGWGYGILFANTNSSSIINSNVYDVFNVNPNVISIYLNYSNNVNVTNVTISNSTNYGIYSNYGDNNTFSHNNISYSNNYDGIELNRSNNSVFDSNTIYKNTFDGIDLEYSGYCNITNNTVYNNYLSGMYMFGAGPCNVINNTIKKAYTLDRPQM
ncbi:MAG: right-handed parallel beta-helix repeat-containing protein [DPANN group archaeon]|nr:right-handed parallel beta-helix repeat-containing protein [DPANN group archaeon]